MEKPFEKIRITPLDIVRAAGGLACELFRMHLLSPVSEHFTVNRGGGPMLDREIYEQEELDYAAIE